MKFKKGKEIDLVKAEVPLVICESEIFQEKLRRKYNTTEINVSVKFEERKFGFTLTMIFKDKCASVFLEGIPTNDDKIKVFEKMQYAIEKKIITDYLK